MPPPILLVDNGSLEPAATLALRALAAQLASRIGQPVEAVSLLHSSAIDPERLAGEPAEILFPALERRLAAGRNDFILVPLFFGPSRALTDFLPENLVRLQLRLPALRVQIAAPLHAPGDERLARILADHVLAEARPAGHDRVILVDHGSPAPAVTAVRNELARQVTHIVGPRVASVSPASMERRAGPEYDFCNPLLADQLERPPWNAGRAIIAMQFLLPGRHAGPNGDVAKICRAAETVHPQLRTTLTKLVGDHPLLVEILADRWRAAAG